MTYEVSAVAITLTNVTLANTSIIVTTPFRKAIGEKLLHFMAAMAMNVYYNVALKLATADLDVLCLMEHMVSVFMHTSTFIVLIVHMATCLCIVTLEAWPSMRSMASKCNSCKGWSTGSVTASSANRPRPNYC